MFTSKALVAGLSLAALVATAPASEAAKWSLFGLGGQQQNPPAADSQTVDVAQAGGDTERLNQLETQMRTLTGEVEQLTHQLQVVTDQLQRMQADSEFRFGQLEGGKGVAKATPPPAAAPAPAPTAQAQAAPQVQPLPQNSGATVVQVAPTDTGSTQVGAPPKDLGQLVLDAPPTGEQPLDLSTLANNGNGNPAIAPAPTAPANNGNLPQVASIAPTGDARTDYDQAYAMITSGQYDLAEKAFREFLSTYPKDELAPEAQYWLGESLFAHGDYASAAEEFKSGYQSYPKSKRAPDSLLKLGLSMAGLGYRDEACKMYTLALKQYPQMPNGLRLRVKTEQASASC
jgi:tol-pal system protein YbgF